MKSAFSRHAEIYALMLRNSLIREMNFKANFLLWMFVEVLWFASQIIFIDVLFSFVNRIGDWTKWEVVLLIGTHQVIGQLFQAFFFVNIADLPELVRTGKLDFLLLQPMDSQFATSVKKFALDNIVSALVGVFFVIFAATKLGLHPTALQILLYIAAIMLGVVIHYSFMFTLASVSFWIVRSQGLIYGYFSFFNIGRYPDVVFKGVFKWVFSWVIPVIIVSNIPARLLAKAADANAALLLQLFFVAILLFSLTRMFWKFALTRYSSASS
ncbi:MAG: ABC-2 family transporter protein [Chthoniobacterales bacterium]